MSEVAHLLRRGAGASVGKTRNQRTADEVADRLVALDATDIGSNALTVMVETLLENGWQPLDLLHVIRRQESTSVSTLAAATLLRHADLTDADARAPREWVDQLSSICEQFPVVAARVEAVPDFLTAYLRSSGKTDFIAASNLWLDVLTLLGRWQHLPRWPELGPKPSQWPRRRFDADPAPGGTATPNVKALGRIRGLLAKADATDFEEEAETLTAKAQELMTRYSIDSLLLGRGDITVGSRRVHIDAPHAPAKAQLLHVVSLANRVKVIWDPTFAIATMVGSPVDVEQTDILFTSLLVQATRALSRSPEAKKRKKARSASFGKAFLYAYAMRIGDRLTDTDSQVLGEGTERSADLLPILAARTVAVDAEFDRLFPTATSMRGPRLDAEGWESGRAAADDADLADTNAKPT